MNLKSRMPRDFYRLFGSKYLDYYMVFLVAVYEESSRSYSTLGLTEQEVKSIINESLAGLKLDWSEARVDEDGVMLSQSNMASICLAHFEQWGWLLSDYDETLNCNVVSFPEYSQLYIELFQKLLSEEDGRERENILAIYSYLYTYNADKEKNNDILRSALKTSRRLVQLLANMQEGMRGYFDELSKQREFRGIQEVLVHEINNSDSRKYAILTTTDSFYRYKEAVKELTTDNLAANELRRQELEEERKVLTPNTVPFYRNERAIEICEEAIEIICQIDREFENIERRYNKLIEQKTIFASRAAARIRYILQEGSQEEDQTVALINLLNRGGSRQNVLEELTAHMRTTAQFRVITEQSLYSRREGGSQPFTPVAVEEQGVGPQEDMESFVLKPLYTKQQIREFMQDNMTDGVFRATADSVQSVEDLEKLFLVWQDMTEHAGEVTDVRLGEEIETEGGLRFSSLQIKENAK
ncbi:Wadjet anti-phage system protein JetA family protein [Hespellia stercorisuis]|uniref:Uncharacterized protein n=1 Tax=Hespellia stercorisuis DSM 15480 TaxID=1121950 RepID=A0A1M6IZW4_9FIRM|nr:Wadjet anti-phage system protein JetA family protein [Hespellia stercorisuis]SHJ39882.1 hypothetical protein SAMN02745243_00486 [Hespellia stercorisuis DSM 15480]